MYKFIIFLFISLFVFIGCSNSITYYDFSQRSDGDEYHLKGRTLESPLPNPSSDIPVEYKVVVKIKVDRNGYVVGAEYSPKGSTTQDSRLISAAIGAATKAKFNKDPNAPTLVTGTITYHFEVNGIRMTDRVQSLNANISNAFGSSSDNQGYVTGDPNPKNRSGSGLDRKDYGFQLAGRSLIGSLPKPSYDISEEGIVVVEITVDRTGRVVSAVPILRGTTTQNSRLWEAAKKAALKARFNADPNAPAHAKGTITYHFVLD